MIMLMKKILGFLGVVFLLLIFSACGVKNAFKTDPNLESLTGLLVEQKTADKENGTHFLINENNEKIAIRSLTINLSGDEYLNNKVQAVAMLNDTDEVYEITGLSVVEILSDKSRQNKLIEYSDTESGFKLKYLDDWKTANSKSGDTVFEAPLVTGANTSTKVTIEQIPFTYEPSVAEDGLTDSPLEAYFESLGQEIEQNQFNKIGVDAMDAVKLSKDRFITYYLYRLGIIYKITFLPADPINNTDENIFNEMLAEFQFIPFGGEELLNEEDGNDGDSSESDLPVLDMELTSFESLPYSFAGKYPAKWYYAGVKSSQNGVLHHYGFSNETINDDNEIVSLDVLAGSIPGGNKITLDGKEFTTISSTREYVVYVSVSGQNYRISGPNEYEDLILVMAASIEQVERN